MKNIKYFLPLLFLCLSFLSYGQRGKVTTKKLDAKQEIKLNGYTVTGISDDGNLGNSSVTLPTQNAVFTYLQSNKKAIDVNGTPSGAEVAGVYLYRDTSVSPNVLYWHDGNDYQTFSGGGGSTELPDGVTIIGDGTSGNKLRGDTTVLATKSDFEKLPNRSTISKRLGYKIIPLDFDFQNIPLDFDSCIWEIRHEHNLQGLEVNFPKDIVLKYSGGMLTNYDSLHFNKTIIDAPKKILFDGSGGLSGSIINDYIEAVWFGMINDNTDQTSKLQHILNGDSIGYSPTINILSNTRFLSKNLVFNRSNINIKHLAKSDYSLRGVGVNTRAQNSSEIVNLMVSGDTGLSNEFHFSSPFHAGVLINTNSDTDVSNLLTGGQDMTNPVRASMLLARNEFGRFMIQNRAFDIKSPYDGTGFNSFIHVIEITGINAADFPSGINIGDRITGVDSDAYGYVRSISNDTIQIDFKNGIYEIGEKLETDIEESVNVIATISNDLLTGGGLLFDPYNGNVGVNTINAGLEHSFNVGGVQNIFKTVSGSVGSEGAKYDYGGLLFSDAATPTKGRLLRYDETANRIQVRDFDNTNNVPALIGSTNMIGHIYGTVPTLISPTAFNLATVTENSVGNYTLAFTAPTKSINYTVNFSSSNPSAFPVVTSKSTTGLEVTVYFTGTSVQVNNQAQVGNIGVTIYGGDK